MYIYKLFPEEVESLLECSSMAVLLLKWTQVISGIELHHMVAIGFISCINLWLPFSSVGAS